MSGIVFPNFAPVAALMQQDHQNALLDARERRLAKAEEDDANAQQYIMPALSGDIAAMAKLPGKYQLQLHTVLQGMDEKKRAQVKEALGWAANRAASILSLPQDQRQAALEAAHAEAGQLGYSPYMANVPRQYGPAVEGWLQYQANSLESHRKAMEGMPTPMGPVGGAAPGTPTAAIPPGVQANAQGGDIDRASRASAGIESGGRYDALGPMTGGDRAYGKYQVMGANIPQWTQLYYGQTLTPQQFLANPDAQEAVFKGKFGEYMRKYGPEGAARAWFAGEGGMNNPNAKDVLGTTVAGYAGKFSNAYGVGSAAGTAPPAFAANAVAPAPMEGMPQFAPAPGNVPLADRPMPQGADSVLQMLAARSQQGAPMPGGFTPAQAPNGPPTAGLTPASEAKFLQQYVPPGYVMAGVQGMPLYDKQGRLGVFPQGATRRDQIQWIDVPKPGENKGPAGPFGGNSLDAQMLNTLHGDPSTQAYAAAYAYMSKPRTAFDESTGRMIALPPMDLSMFPRPAYSGNAGGGMPAAGPSPAMTGGATPVGTGGNTTTVQVPGSGAATVTQAMDPKKPTELKELETDATALLDALNRYNEVFRSADTPAKLAALFDNPQSPEGQKLLGAYEAFKVALRGKSFVNTGVLQPGEDRNIEKMAVSPHTLRGAFASPDALKAKNDEFANYVKNKLRAGFKANGITLPAGLAETQGQQQGQTLAPPKVGEVVDGYLFKGGNPAERGNWEKVR